ncbi:MULTISPECIES: hypothetical protein [unclassified Pseudoalteromonas]|uniref:hypothetical protein n=1 Tax=unclassified Pseudoalteromonas TaxID=194690 RepID=UPI00110B51F3|nr:MULTISPECIES: hypothetical protein [unclassified Pseudoalteromonas]MCH2086767.1 hypothetical protein [Pseudoalteromonas sp.]TMP49349.1 hypothetical protein CWB80_01205 [Pseudoalteromonas sp. S1650]TMP67534.1 hypothetical protein CWB79_07810 [Pseudoalteromonas sp. S1649]
MTQPKSILLSYIICFVWCVILPLFWVASFSERIEVEYFEIFLYFIPELSIATVFIFSLVGLFKLYKVAAALACIAAVLGIIAKFLLGSPTFGGIEVGIVLLLVLSYQLFNQSKRASSPRKLFNRGK